jgi:hypothetical protein
VRDPAHQQKVFNGPIGKELFKTVSDKMDVTVLSTCYLGTRQVNLREVRAVKTPADLKGVKLRMPGSKDWLFLGERPGRHRHAAGLWRGLSGPEDRHHRRPGQPAAQSVRAAKFYEVTKQIVLTSHLVDGIFIAISNKAFNALTAAQKQKVTAAAQAAAAFNNDNRLQGRRPDHRVLQEGRLASHHTRCGCVPQGGAGHLPKLRVRQGLAQRPRGPHQRHQVNQGHLV